MSYSDAKYDARVFHRVASAVSFGTATASSATGHDLSDVCAGLPVFPRRSTVSGFKLRCTTIPDTGSTAVVAQLMNGTTTVGTAVLTTATADQWLTGVVTAANSTFAAADEAKINLTGTATASADANGAYDVWFEVSEAFAA